MFGLKNTSGLMGANFFLFEKSGFLLSDAIEVSFDDPEQERRKSIQNQKKN